MTSSKSNSLANVIVRPYGIRTRTKWYRFYFTDFLSQQGGLALSIVATVGLFVSAYQDYTQSSEMLSSLYGETELNDHTESLSAVKYQQDEATKTFESLVKSRRDLRGNYCSFLFYQVTSSLFCCCPQYFDGRKGCLSRRAKKYAKM